MCHEFFLFQLVSSLFQEKTAYNRCEGKNVFGCLFICVYCVLCYVVCSSVLAMIGHVQKFPSNIYQFRAQTNAYSHLPEQSETRTIPPPIIAKYVLNACIAAHRHIHNLFGFWWNCFFLPYRLCNIADMLFSNNWQIT